MLATAAVLLASTTGLATATVSGPTPGPMFNNPKGNKEAKNRILWHVISAINNVPRHGTIQIAAYSFDRPDVADALLRAHARDVDVQMVLNDNWTSQATLRLQRALGTDPNRSSFVAICHGSCRGGAGNQHMKFYLFSKVGSTPDVTMIGSANMTGFGAIMQWNDLFTFVRNAALRDEYVKMFQQLARNRKVADPYVVSHAGGYESQFHPDPGTTQSTDPDMRRLDQVHCRATGGAGVNGHTAIRIVMYGWNTSRGEYLARKVADLGRQGCNIHVILSDGGGRVYRILKAGGALVKSADLDLNNNPNDGFEGSGYELFTHEKWMILSGGFGPSSASWQVWTGSENWSNMSLLNDEVTIQVPSRAAYGKYLANFDYIWKYWSRWL